MLQRWHLAKEQISHAPVLPPLLGSAMLWFLNNRIHSEILLALPFEEREIAPPKLEFVRLQSHQLLHKAEDTIEFAYFFNSGLISILSVFPTAGLLPGVGAHYCVRMRLLQVAAHGF